MILALFDLPRAYGALTWVAILWFVVLLVVRAHMTPADAGAAEVRPAAEAAEGAEAGRDRPAASC